MQVIHVSQSQEKDFDQFVTEHPLGSIQQTFSWGEFQKKVKGRGKFFPLAIMDRQGKIRGTALLIKQKLPLGFCWLYCPRGPLVNFGTKVSDLFMEEVKKIAKKEKAIFFRMDPEMEIPQSIQEKQPILLAGFKMAHANYQPEDTLKIDLSMPEEEILKQMKPKGRYNIKLAEKKEVKIVDGYPIPKAVDEFYALLRQTTERDKFSAHDKEFYKDMLTVLEEKQLVKMYLAEFKHKVIAGIIVTFFKDTAIYYFGASGNDNRELMAPYLLQWTAIKEAKARGMKWFDFLGIAPDNAEGNHSWHGVTEFKKKFGGRAFHFMSAQEYVFKPFWYWMMKMAKGIKA